MLIILFQSFMDTDLHGRKYCCVDNCPFKINNNSNSFTQMVDYICEHCKNNFCLNHFVDHLEEQKCSSNCRGKTSCCSFKSSFTSALLQFVFECEI